MNKSVKYQSQLRKVNGELRIDGASKEFNCFLLNIFRNRKLKNRTIIATFV